MINNIRFHTHTQCSVILCWLVENYLYFPFSNLLIRIRKLPSLCVSPSISPPLEVTVPPQRPLLCGVSPLTSGKWRRTGLPFSQGHFLTALSSSSAFNITTINLYSFIPLLPPGSCCWSSVHLVSTPAVRCCGDSMQHTVGAFQIAGVVLQCLYW